MAPCKSTDELTAEISLESWFDRPRDPCDSDDAHTSLLSEQPVRFSNRTQNVLPQFCIGLSCRSLTRHSFRQARRVRRGQVGIWLRRLLRFACGFLGLSLAIIIFFGIFLPSYTRPPPHYTTLRNRVKRGWASGSANVNKEKVFIAASLFDPGGELAAGRWAANVLQLIHILGPENVYLSIYENDSGPQALQALASLETHILCNHTLISEEHLDLGEIPQVQLPDGTRHVKRIAYLAEVRNRALRPLENAHTRFDKLLFLNDVVFDPIDAAQLLFSTNMDSTGRTQYRSACAVDFINPFKFYDTFASRDLDGYSMGVPFFPWFAAAGGDGTLDDLLADKDTVRVRSCWGGMVSFDAKFFQNWDQEAYSVPTAANKSPVNLIAPYRFRAETDLWWDSSECCLIQADIQSPNISNPEIFMNPFVRVAYDARTLSWLWFTKRFEKLYTPIHFIADILVSLPDFNPRRDEVPWESVEEVIWLPDDRIAGNGSWQKLVRTAKHDGFCGRRALQIMKQNVTSGEKNYEFVVIPGSEDFS